MNFVISITSITPWPDHPGQAWASGVLTGYTGLNGTISLLVDDRGGKWFHNQREIAVDMNISVGEQPTI